MNHNKDACQIKGCGQCDTTAQSLLTHPRTDEEIVEEFNNLFLELDGTVNGATAEDVSVYDWLRTTTAAVGEEERERYERAIKYAWTHATPDSWNVPCLYRKTFYALLRKRLKALTPNQDKLNNETN